MTITRLQGKKILIVDDDEDILGSIDLALRAEGAATETVTDGNAAVSACDEDVPDAVVLDMMLPKRSGASWSWRRSSSRRSRRWW
ncbi:MAG: response regulator transcription factor [Planctomycetota bacterium]|jgi:two-component system response regulator VicR